MFVRGGITWIESGGGPLVLLEERLRDVWAGIGQGEWEPGSGTDYDRACEVSDWIGLMEHGDGEAVVLGSEPAPTAFLNTALGPMLLRWIHAPAGWRAPAVEALMEQTWETSASWEVRSAPQIIQDAALGGQDTDADRLVLDLRPGRYEILTAEYKPDAEVCMILHRLRELTT